MTTLSPFFAVSRRVPFGAFDALFNDVLRRPAGQSVRAIPFDVVSQGDSYVVTADVPGYRKEDIAIEINGAIGIAVPAGGIGFSGGIEGHDFGQVMEHPVVKEGAALSYVP